MSLRKSMADHNSINFLEFRKLFSIWFEVVCEFADWNFFVIGTQIFGILIVLVGDLVKYLA